MNCAFSTSSETSKRRFLVMAKRLESDYQFDMESNAMSRDLSAKIRFQKMRVEDILKDKYECCIHQYLPRAPPAVTSPFFRTADRDTPAQLPAVKEEAGEPGQP